MIYGCCGKPNGTINTTVTNLPLTAFSDLRSTELLPVAGWTFNYNINSDLIKTTLTGSGTATTSDSMATLQTGAAAASSAKIETIRALRYTPGLGALVRFTAVFTTGVVNSLQIIGAGDDLDGFFFGYNGDSFGILRRQNGVDNWIPQSSWNVDKFNGIGPSRVNLQPTLGNVYAIQYQWLGFGDISFYIENPTTGKPTLVHLIQYANANTLPSVFNPTFPIMAQVLNTTNTSNITLRTPSAMGMVEGNGNTSALVTDNSFSNTKAVTSVATSIFTLRNNSTFQGKINRVRIRFLFLSLNASGANSVTVSMIRNGTLGGTPVFTNISPTTSVVAVDTSGTTVTGGTNKFSTTVDSPGNAQILLDSIGIELSPGDTMTLACRTAAGNSTCTVAVSWGEKW